MSGQPSFDLTGGSVYGVPNAPRGRGELGAGDPLPQGPYRVGLTHIEGGPDGPPWTVCCGDGRAVAGHVPSLECATAIVDALNSGTAPPTAAEDASDSLNSYHAAIEAIGEQHRAGRPIPDCMRGHKEVP